MIKDTLSKIYLKLVMIFWALFLAITGNAAISVDLSSYKLIPFNRFTIPIFLIGAIFILVFTYMVLLLTFFSWIVTARYFTNKHIMLHEIEKSGFPRIIKSNLKSLCEIKSK